MSDQLPQVSITITRTSSVGDLSTTITLTVSGASSGLATVAAVEQALRYIFEKS